MTRLFVLLILGGMLAGCMQGNQGSQAYGGSGGPGGMGSVYGPMPYGDIDGAVGGTSGM